ncbi:DJ-1 protein-PfpI domain-containing protein [Mycena kentingensis (nom. inval.)]|nr:DJ-1 protein-PfpI domain-containing protein [Mycena kentingensis (nom. inval.)]
MKYNSPLLSDRGSLASILSSDTLRPVPSPTASCSSTDFEPCEDPRGDKRWSDVVPPDTGLSFSVVAKDSDALSFSTNPDLLVSSVRRRPGPEAPSDADAASRCNRSQVLTMGPSILGLSDGAGTEYTRTPATMQFFRDNFPYEADAFFPPPRDRPTAARTQTSSTMDGLDVYLRGSQLGQAHNANRYASCFREFDDEEFESSFDPRTPFARAHMQSWMRDVAGGGKGRGYVRDDVSDEGFFESEMYRGMGPRVYQGEDQEDHLPSRFSTTTTSTSNFITVEKDKDFETATATWTALEAPNTPGYSRLMFSSPRDTSNRRLQKTRPVPVPGPASPADVLNREYNHRHRFPFPVPPPAPASPDASPSPPPRRAKTPTPSPCANASASPRTRARNLSSRSMPSLPKLKLGSLKRRMNSSDGQGHGPGVTRSASASASASGPQPGWVWVDFRENRGQAQAAMAGVREEEDDEAAAAAAAARMDVDDEEGRKLPIWRQHATTLSPVSAPG